MFYESTIAIYEESGGSGGYGSAEQWEEGGVFEPGRSSNHVPGYCYLFTALVCQSALENGSAIESPFLFVSDTASITWARGLLAVYREIGASWCGVDTLKVRPATAATCRQRSKRGWSK